VVDLLVVSELLLVELHEQVSEGLGDGRFCFLSYPCRWRMQINYETSAQTKYISN
jgi:hypothetical protein